MVAVAYPLVAEAVFAAANAEFGPGVNVSYGRPMTDPGYGLTELLVDFDFDPNSETAGNAGTFTQEWATVTGPSRDETGSIPFSVYHLTGDEGTPGALSAMQAVFAVAEALATLVSSTGVGEPVQQLQWTNAVENATFWHEQTDQGSEAVLRFSIGYKARI